jgi:two-component system, cell cycle response regulator DivK
MIRILMVEDDENSRLIVRDLLERMADCDLIEAATGPDGVGAAETYRPDLILMDVQLPGFDGLEATRRIKANPMLRHIPIIAVTSYAMSGDAGRAQEAGCHSYLSKPFDPTELLATLRRLLP